MIKIKDHWIVEEIEKSPREFYIINSKWMIRKLVDNLTKKIFKKKKKKLKTHTYTRTKIKYEFNYKLIYFLANVDGSDWFSTVEKCTKFEENYQLRKSLEFKWKWLKRIKILGKQKKRVFIPKKHR